jgi:hypothetical protein
MVGDPRQHCAKVELCLAKTQSEGKTDWSPDVLTVKDRFEFATVTQLEDKENTGRRSFGEGQV